MKMCLVPGEHHPSWQPLPWPMQPPHPTPALPSGDTAHGGWTGQPGSHPASLSSQGEAPGPAHPRYHAGPMVLPQARGNEPGINPPEGQRLPVLVWMSWCVGAGQSPPTYLLPTREINLTFLCCRQGVGKGLPQRERKMIGTQPRGHSPDWGVTGSPRLGGSLGGPCTRS